MNAAAPVSTVEETEVYDLTPGSWQDTISKSAVLKARGDKAAAKASTLLWQGAQGGITDWLADDAETDVNGEGLYNELVTLLGKPRRGDANKIKTVALAVKDHGLVLSQQPSLTKAYAEAKRLTVTVQQDKDDDHAADEAITALAETAPKSTSTAEGAAQLVLKGGVDEAARLLLDALNGPSGENNTAAHRAFLRAVSQDIAGRQPKAEPKVASTDPKAGATKVAKGAVKTAKPKAVKSGAAKAKPVQANPKVARKVVAEAEPAEPEAALFQSPDVEVIAATDVEVSEDVTPEVPVQKAQPVKAQPVKAQPIKAQPVKTKAKPVVRPIRRS